ncbi:unnamed protein product [Urochloa decumbens]|uniref:F-box domain-containing protein n=1 Tax=Urochloa decumbens TaxID=240449 RepID=A0ABC9BWH6_9POAL
MERPKRSAPAGLPYDSILEILARLPARSVYRSKCVAKAWRDLVDDPLNRKKLPQTLEGFFIMKPGTVGVDGVEHFGFINLLPRPVPLDIDPSFSFLKKLPETENLSFLDSCNGLLLFVHARKSDRLYPFDVLGYVVCNPATKQWEAVPACGCLPMTDCSEWYTFLAFHPAVSSHFQLINCWKQGVDEEGEDLEDEALSVCTYSSGTRTWSRRSQTDWNNEQGHLEGWRHQGTVCYPGAMPQHAFVNCILHLMVWDLDDSPIVAAVDIQGKTQRIIKIPAAAEGMRWAHAHRGHISQSQGRLHYINIEIEVGTPHPEKCHEWSIWDLQDYDTQEWVLKDTVSFHKLFGENICRNESCTGCKSSCAVVAIHQDCNVVFFLQSQNRLIAYDMDRKEVTVVATFENKIWVDGIAPYVPYFTELPVLTNKH